MSLDKQRILSELGSVMNQLQSADCGCMGKLFSNSGQGSPGGGYSLPTCGGCRRSYCHGHGAPCAGEPYGNSGGMGMPCMGTHCNPPKLYADTYNYLNQNLMQPAVKEVYNDLSTISPANTIGNNPMANQMGLSQGNTGNPMMGQGHMGAMASQNQMSAGGMGNPNAMQNMGGIPSGGMMENAHQPMDSMGGTGLQPMGQRDGMGQMGGMGSQPMGQMGRMGSQQMGQMGGMGSHIVNMMMGGSGTRPKNMPGPGGQLTEPMVIDAPQSPHGKVGVTPLSPAMGANPGQFGANNMRMASMGQGDPSANQAQYNTGNMGMSKGNFLNPTTQYVTQENMNTLPDQGQPMTGNNMMQQGNLMATNMAQNMNPGSQQAGSGFMNPNPAAQKMANAHRPNPYGQHTQGVTKFNEMFPGVMQGGDLGFDPMAIAIQMNPANQQRSAMDTMQKLMNNKQANLMQPAMTGANAFNQQQNPNQSQLQQNIPANQMANQQMLQNQIAPADQTGNQQVIQGQQQPANPNAGIMNQQQLVYHSQVPQQQMHGQLDQRGQQQIDPNTGAIISTPDTEGYENMSEDPNAQMQQPPVTETEPPAQPMIKEPIFPADTSRNQGVYYTKPQKYYQYNTLGQPIQMLPGNAYHTPEPSLPQTLSPNPKLLKMRNDQGKLGVKNTISKTSLVGNRPVGRTPSRNQLQQIYQQYKGSQSYTQQNIAPGQGGTQSDGKLYAVPKNSPPMTQIPVEKVGGDTAANNGIANRVEVKGHIGDDSVANKPHGDVVPEMAAPMKHTKLRNGLQDMIYTAYPTNAAWSFHGEYYPTPKLAATYRSHR